MPIDPEAERPYNPVNGHPGWRLGFTLTEVLVAMGILAIGSVAALSLFAAAVATQKRAVDRVKSAYLAEEAIALVEARLVGDADLASLEVLGGKREGYPEYFTYDVTLTPQDDLEVEVLVEVTVIWKTQGRDREAVYRTILLRSLGEADFLGGQVDGAQR